MARDLIVSHSAIGRTRGDLVVLLGQPEKYSDTKENQLFYLIREDWSGVDPVRIDHLVITMDHNGRAISAVIDVFKR